MARWQDELERHARRTLPREVYEYVALGAADGLTAAEAAERWRAVRFRPRVLRDVTTVDLSTTLLGRATAVPWGIAPTTLQCAAHPDGEVAMARATAATQGVMVVSSNAGTGFEAIAATGVRWWLQAYLPADRTLAEPMLARATAAGAEAVVLTVDTPVVGTKHPRAPRSIWEVVDSGTVRVNFDPGFGSMPGSEKAADLGPHDIGWLAEATGLPVVVKGVLRGDDAVRCLQAGAAAVWVSTHGGRQLDRAASTAECLPEVVAAVAGVADDPEVYVDGGLASGLDILAALALGARCAFLGRLPVYSLVGGEPGVTHMHQHLESELMEAMRLAGCRRVSDTRHLVGPSR